MRNEKTFVAFGQTYKVKQFSAAEGFGFLMMGKLESVLDLPVLTVLRHTGVKVNGEWLALDSRAAINEHVKDAAVGAMSPSNVLLFVLEEVYQFSMGFFKDWKPVSIPRRFTSAAVDYIESKTVHPIMSYLIEKKHATLREMEEYYSMADAFMLNDQGTRQDLNACLAQEAAAEEAASKR